MDTRVLQRVKTGSPSLTGLRTDHQVNIINHLDVMHIRCVYLSGFFRSEVCQLTLKKLSSPLQYQTTIINQN